MVVDSHLRPMTLATWFIVPSVILLLLKGHWIWLDSSWLPPRYMFHYCIFQGYLDMHVIVVTDSHQNRARQLSDLFSLAACISPSSSKNASAKGEGLKVNSSLNLPSPISKVSGIFNNRFSFSTSERYPRAVAFLLGLLWPTTWKEISQNLYWNFC